MVAVTYGVARAAVRKLGGSQTAGAAAETGKGWFSRIVKAMMDARMRQAQRELAVYKHLNFEDVVGKDH